MFLCFQVPVWSMAGERRGRWQLGKSSDRTSGVTWWRGGRWPVDRDASRAGLSFPECSDCAGITGPKQYVPSHRAFFSTIADLLVYTACLMQTHPAPCNNSLSTRVYDASGLSTFVVWFVFLTVFDYYYFFLSSEILSVEVQEDMREAANNLVKHFHKPEQEVCPCNSKCVPQKRLFHSFNPLALDEE